MTVVSAPAPSRPAVGDEAVAARRARRWDPIGYAFVTPAVVVAGVFLAWPAVRTLWVSFTDWDLLTSPRWVGLENYRSLGDDDAFWSSVRVTVLYVAGTTGLTIPLAFLVATGLSRLGRLRGLLSSIYFLPAVLSTVVASSLFVSVFHPDGGVLQLLPLPSGLSERNWYQDSGLVLPGLVLFSVWKGIGVYTVLFLAGIDNLPAEPAEAARLEGASAWQTLRHVTLPQLRPVFLFATVVCVVFSVQNFALVYASTKGGPGSSSETLPILIYERAFRDLAAGEAAAISMVLFAAVAATSVVLFRVMGRRGRYA